jgi:hypothetical protein
VWGIAWFAFMRREWTDAAAAIGQPLPWTPRFWIVWVPITLFVGVGVIAYVADRTHRAAVLKAALAASLVLWVPATIGMSVWAWQQSLSQSMITIDSAVNLVAVIVAALVGGWSVRAPREQVKPVGQTLASSS